MLYCVLCIVYLKKISNEQNDKVCDARDDAQGTEARLISVFFLTHN